jgi:hypothetical protein
LALLLAAKRLVDVDASAAALVALKQKGATEKELNAVLWAEPFGAARRRKEEEDRAVPDLPGRAGVYLKDSSGWIAVPSFLFWAPFYSGWNGFRGARESSIALGSGHSGLQIPEVEPRKPATAAVASTIKNKRVQGHGASGRRDPNDHSR